ncbi:MAG: hypothetical protein LAP21_10980 [Acidobacteriia bacterium]|nr:hypothetical protein [Terriglobia bacterium]
MKRWKAVNADAKHADAKPFSPRRKPKNLSPQRAQGKAKQSRILPGPGLSQAAKILSRGRYNQFLIFLRPLRTFAPSAVKDFRSSERKRQPAAHGPG